MHLTVVLVMGMFLTAPTALQAATQPPATADDALVLEAIIEHTILPEVLRSGGVRAKEAIVVVAGQTQGMCNASPPCRIPEHWHRFLTPAVARGWPGMIADDKTREAAVASLEARNATPQPLPALDHPRVVLTAARPLSRDIRGSLANVVGITSLSLPGYSGDGVALVYGSYTSCDSTCGKSWLFVVRKLGDSWQVQWATVTSIG